ncbi:MAG: hypothetical protein MHPSP_004420, partial [Paramarteilia canceri]
NASIGQIEEEYFESINIKNQMLSDHDMKKERKSNSIEKNNEAMSIQDDYAQTGLLDKDEILERLDSDRSNNSKMSENIQQKAENISEHSF